MSRFARYQDHVTFLYQWARRDPVLHRLEAYGDAHSIQQAVRDALEYFGVTPSSMRLIHVLGTSGKGTLVTRLHQLMHATGEWVGSYVSPHIVTPLERFRIGNGLVPVEMFCDVLDDLRMYVCDNQEQGRHMPYIALLFVAAMVIFHRAGCRAVIIEVPSGGGAACTAVLPYDVVIQTGVSWDHMEHLGPTLADVARHDAGAITQGSLAISAVSDEGHKQIWQEAADSAGATARFVPYDHIPEAVAAHYGIAGKNIAMLPFPMFPGRCEMFRDQRPHVLIDGAHNEEKMAFFAKQLGTIREQGRYDEVHALVALRPGHDVGRFFAPLFPLVDTFTATTPSLDVGKTFLTPVDLADELRHHTYPPSVGSAATPQIAYAKIRKDAGPNDLIVVTGSMYMIGEVRALFETEEDFLARNSQIG